MTLEMRGICKSFGSNDVLKHVDFSIQGGEICALLGENGAGKSTLMNILGGVLPADRGEIVIDGAAVHFRTPSDSLSAGVAFIHQELSLINDLAIYENMFIGRELKTKYGLLDAKTMIQKTQEVFDRLELHLDPRTMVRELDASYKQIVEISRAMMMEASLIIMDEPTTSLTDPEIERVFDMMRMLQKQNVAIVFISHKLKEVMEVCNRYTVLRDGNMVAAGPVAEVTTADLARFMVGHDVRTENLHQDKELGGEILRGEGLGDGAHFRDISFTVHAGEVLGVTGLLGDGRSELFQAVFGDLPYTGQLFMEGQPVKVTSTPQAIRLGMDRSVFLELLEPDNPEGVGVEDFLMKARTRAAVSAPVLGTVYEASQAQGYWFVTSEQLGGASLQSMLDRGQTLSMKDLLKVIETVGGMCGRYERLQTAFNVMEPRHIFLDDKSAVRLMNTAMPGDFHEEISRAQMKRLGADLLPLVTPDVPGTTRMRTLLEWMREGQNGKPMQWDQVMELIAAVREQLGLSPRATTHRYTVPVEPRRNSGKWMLWTGTGLLGAGIAAAAVFLLFPREEASAPAPPPAPKHYPDFSASDHTEVRVNLPGGGELIVGAHEITLESYRLFLDQWARLTPELREEYSHPDQPDKQTATHIPEDWEAMWKAASTPGGKWKGRKITPRSPVVNVTFWDAWAYASWKPVAPGEPRYRLPARGEWMALGNMLETGEKGDKTLVIDRYSNDYDLKTGICGMASGVMEWTSSMEKDPARVKEPPGPVACGGDWRQPGITNRVEYLRSRGESRDNLGFRIVRDVR